VSKAPILIDDSLLTARFAHPFRAGWLPAEGVELRTPAAAAELRSFSGVALVDAVLAAALIESWVILPRHAVASRRESMLNLVTDRRPDGLEHIMLGISGVSDVAQAVADATLPRFYGIVITGWSTEPVVPGVNSAYLAEGAHALADIEDDGLFHEDLGRAWFLLTQTPFVTHICIAPRGLVEHDRASVLAALDVMQKAVDASNERARELRRDLTGAYGVDRELLNEVLADQSNVLGAEERAGLKSLYSFSGRRESAERLARAIVEL
jgi:predicted solute-binding protein